MSASNIEWTERTWNPVTGCTKVSPGCKRRYAERMALHLQATGAAGYAGGFALTLREDRLGQPLARHKPTVYFVCSMADLFHEAVPDDFIDRVLATIRRTPRHTYLLLTKRAERLSVFFASRPVPPNVWLGVTVEDRRYGLPRIAQLRQIPARVRFLSVEPTLTLKAYFQSIRARTASAAWRSDSPSTNCITVIKPSRQGLSAGWPRVGNQGANRGSSKTTPISSRRRTYKVAFGKGGPRDLLGFLGNWGNRLRLERHGYPPQV